MPPSGRFALPLALALLGGCRAASTEPSGGAAESSDLVLACRFTGGEPYVDETLTVRADGSIELRAEGASEAARAHVPPEKLLPLRRLLLSEPVAALDDDYTERISPDARPAELAITLPTKGGGRRTIKTKAFGDHPPALESIIRQIAPLMRRAQRAAEPPPEGS